MICHDCNGRPCPACQVRDMEARIIDAYADCEHLVGTDGVHELTWARLMQLACKQDPPQGDVAAIAPMVEMMIREVRERASKDRELAGRASPRTASGLVGDLLEGPLVVTLGGVE